MKYTTFLLVPLAAGAVLQTRQLSGLLGMALKESKPAKIEEAPPTAKRPGVKRMLIYYGPYDLLPAAKASKQWSMMRMDPNSNTFNYMVGGMPRDITILRSNTRLQYLDGKPAEIDTGVYNHHVLFFDSSKSAIAPVSCGDPKANSKAASVPMSIFMGMGEENGPTHFTTQDAMFNSGYYLSEKDKLMITGEIINYGNETKQVYSVSDVEYLPGKPEGFMEASVTILTVNQCDGGNPMLRPPQGQKIFSFKSKNMFVNQDGYILTRRGHLHDGGENIDFLVNGKSICNSKAVYGEGGKTGKAIDGQKWETVSSMVECSEPFKVSKGDKIDVIANYNLEKHPARQHAMGGMAEEMGLMNFAFAAAKPS